jgi:hypothetical protein
MVCTRIHFGGISVEKHMTYAHVCRLFGRGFGVIHLEVKGFPFRLQLLSPYPNYQWTQSTFHVLSPLQDTCLVFLTHLFLA